MRRSNLFALVLVSALLTALLIVIFHSRPAEAQAGSLVVSVTATVPIAGPSPGVFTITRAGDASQPLRVAYDLGGTAARDLDYTIDSTNGGNPVAGFEPVYATGKVGQAVNLNGTSQFVRIPDAPSLRVTNLTIEGWINFANNVSECTIAGKAVGAASSTDSYILYYKDGALRGSVGINNVVASPVIFNFTPTLNTWYHVGFTFDTTSHAQTLYLNGVNVATNVTTFAAPDYDSNPYQIGADTEFGNKSFFFPGRLDEITLYNRALTTGEIQSIFAADSAGKCKPGAAVPNCVAPPSGIVSWVAGDGNINDLMSVRSPFAPGKVAQAFVLNGGRLDRQEQQYVQYASNASQDPTAEATVDAWINFTELPSEVGRFMTVLAKSAQFRFFDLVALGDNRIRFFVGGGSSVATNTVFQKGQWYHVAATYKANTELKIYVNGVLENTQPISETRATNTNPLTIGNSAFDLNRNFSGLIDEAQMYNRALSAAEIQTINNADSAGLCKPVLVANCVQPPTGLVGWWPADGHARDLVTKARGTVIGYDDRIIGQSFTFAAGQSSITIKVAPLFSPNSAGKTVTLTLLPDPQNVYAIDALKYSATVFLNGRAPTTDVSLTSIAPNKGGNTGSVTPGIYGFGFKPGVTVKLVRAGQADIIATQTVPAADEASVAATFDLNGKVQGVYDVVVSNAGGTPKTLAAAFTIEQAMPASLSINVIARSVMRIGSEYNFYVQYGNGGDTDITNAPLWVGVPNYVSIVPDTNLSFEVVPINNSTYIKIIVPRVRAGSDQSPEVLTLKVKVADPANIHRDFHMNAFIGNPQLDPNNLGASASARENSFIEGFGEGIRPSANILPPSPTKKDCVNYFIGTDDEIAHFSDKDLQKAMQRNVLKDMLLTGGADYAKCHDIFFPPAPKASPTPTPAGPPPDPAADFWLDNQALGYAQSHPVSPQTPNDPNEKAGPGGAGTAGYITGKASLPYTIYFENKDTADLPAQDVSVTDQLDPAKVELSTFSFGLISFGNRTFTPPAGQKSFIGYVDLRPQKNLLVKIAGDFNPTTGSISWTLNSLDAGTGRAPDDPQAGFLPPNKTSPEGQASVTFKVFTKAGLTTNTAVTNIARIIFDVNAPIDTNQHLNTIDKSPPMSHVTALSASQPEHSFVVNWSGTDAGAGISGYNVFVSENGGPFTFWQFGTTATSGIFYGGTSKTYSFYSIAFDAVGNREPAKTTAEATTLTPAGNPIDDARWFVRQHYLDFLSREPDDSGLQFWINEIASCGTNQQCIEVKRINVSAAYFLSIEFQQTGYLVERLYKAAYGNASGASTFGGAHQLAVPIVRFNEFLPDTQRIGQGVVVGQTGWEIVLENNKVAFAAEFVQRSRFTTAYATTLTPAQFVDQLFANAGVTPTATDRNAAIAEFGSATNTSDVAARGRALRRVAENATLVTNEFNRAFVLMQYFGYLRRDPNSGPDTDYTGYDFWLTKLNQFNGNFVSAEMVKAFITSTEYRSRFGLQ